MTVTSLSKTVTSLRKESDHRRRCCCSYVAKAINDVTIVKLSIKLRLAIVTPDDVRCVAFDLFI